MTEDEGLSVGEEVELCRDETSTWEARWLVAWHDTGDAAQQETGQQPKSEWADGLDSRDLEFAIFLSVPAQGVEGAADELDVVDRTDGSAPAGGHVVDDRMQPMVDRVRELTHLAVGQPAVQVAQLGFGARGCDP